MTSSMIYIGFPEALKKNSNTEILKAEAAILQIFGNQEKIFIEGNLYNATDFEEDRKLITTGKNTFTSLLYKGDYRDYYYKMGIRDWHRGGIEYISC